MEIWNNVFSQFNNMGDGTYTELQQKNIDTGMGLERLACVMQGVDNMFEVDSIRRILDAVCAVSGKTYGADEAADISIRVITDHIRSGMFMIADGVIPSNEGRGYVLRRLLRRACRHGKLLGINHSFLPALCEVAIGESQGAYPELDEKRAYILKVIAMEEERFDATIDAGLSILSNLIRRALHLFTGQLPEIPFYETPAFYPASNTADALRWGTDSLLLAGVKELLKEAGEKSPPGMPAPYCVACGGDRDFFLRHLPGIFVKGEEDFTLTGVQLIWEQNHHES